MRKMLKKIALGVVAFSAVAGPAFADTTIEWIEWGHDGVHFHYCDGHDDWIYGDAGEPGYMYYGCS